MRLSYPPTMPATGYMRLKQIIGTHAASPRKKEYDIKKADRKSEEPFYDPIIPVSKSTWWAGVKSGRYPAPFHHLGARITVWKVEDIQALIEKI